MKIFTKGLLVSARKLKSVYLLKIAYCFVTKKSDALSCYYIALRYFTTDSVSLDIVLNILIKFDLSLAEIAHPILEGYLKENIRIDNIEKLNFMIQKDSNCSNINSFNMLVKYIYCFLNKDFILSYKIWKDFDDVNKCLSNLRDDINNKKINNKKIAIILPGISKIEFGKEIDQYDLVGRTSLQPPSKENHKYSGSRLDYSFLNNDRYTEFLNWDNNDLLNLSTKVVSNISCKKINNVNIKNIPILEMEEPDAPICSYSFITLRIAHWCLNRGSMKPYFYNGDFYLNDKIYESENYDLKEKLLEERNIINSYLLHDIFFVHASLKILYQKNLVGARGTLRNILEMSGEEFAQALTKRWNDNINI